MIGNQRVRLVVEDTHKRSLPSGSGIGLAVVNELVRGMGGALVLEDSPLGGLRVRVQLPSAMAAPQATHVTA